MRLTFEGFIFRRAYFGGGGAYYRNFTVIKSNKNTIKCSKDLTNSTRKLLFNFKRREIEILKKTCLSKYGCHGNAKSRGQSHVISNCYQIIFRKSQEGW